MKESKESISIILEFKEALKLPSCKSSNFLVKSDEIINNCSAKIDIEETKEELRMIQAFFADCLSQVDKQIDQLTLPQRPSTDLFNKTDTGVNQSIANGLKNFLKDGFLDN